MAGKIDQRIAELGITLPEPGNPVANFVPYVSAGGLLFMSGQLPRTDGKLAYKGKLTGTSIAMRISPGSRKS